MGPAYLLEDPAQTVVPDRVLRSDEIPSENRRVKKALRLARDEVAAISKGVEFPENDPGLLLLNAHRLLLEDQALEQRIVEEIKSRKVVAEGAVHQVFAELIAHMENSKGEYFRARSEDMRDVMHRLLRHLQESEERLARQIPRGVILVTSELSPSESACMDPGRILGLATDHGGPTNHAAIMARSRGIPAVLGLGNITARVRAGDRVILDGSSGRVVLRPGTQELKAFEKRKTEERRVRVALARIARLPSHTRDLQRIPLLANIETAEEADQALREGAEGIGLYRTEFFHLLHSGWPTEEDQYRAYRRVVRKMGKRPVVVRTMDVGGDKFAAVSGIGREGNPFLGMRGIRFSLAHPEIFRTQLRAVLRVAAHGNVRILIPMVSNMDEVREAKHLIWSVRNELEREGLEIRSLPLGIMIETPSMVILSDILSREVDFFSIGSNDLIQYTLAADRGNEKVAHVYDPFHPAVLRSIYRTVASAHRAGISVSSCGEMSGDPVGALVLMGLGVDQLSVSPSRLKPVKKIIRSSTIREVRHVVEDAMTCATSSEVREILTAAFPEQAKETLRWADASYPASRTN
jgi:phosphotransferase system enzyme I (PtsI)